MSYCFLTCQLMSGVLVEFLNKLSAMLNRLFHCALLRELSVLVVILAILLVLAPVGIGAEIVVVSKRNAAALT